ncbi:MAG: hypothetical protein GX231_05275 [Tissierellia bacterium]|nr:hypothetical protein [Tissierellia bacterium]
MKHISIITIILVLFLSGCSIDDLPFLNRESKTVSESNGEIKYKIDNVILSKGYQSIEPNIEVIKKNNEIQLLINIGLLETSGVEIKQLIKDGNMINIHVANLLDYDNVQLAVPQILLDLKNISFIDLDNMKFNIINENFQPISLKLNLSDAINKVKSDFNVTSNTLPKVNLEKDDGNFIWDITYYSIFDKGNIETPIVNLSVKLDANTAELLQAKKGFISSFIDEGHVLDYVTNKYILYRKVDIDPITAVKTESIYSYDIEKNTKTRLYFTNFNILSAYYSPSYDYISVVENDGTSSGLFIVESNDNKAYKVLFDDPLSPDIVRWKDDHNLLILTNEKSFSRVYNHDISNSKTDLISRLNMNLIDFRIKGDSFILVETHDTDINKNIYLTKDWKEISYLGKGFSIRFVNDNMIAYLKKNENNSTNILNIYDVDNMKIFDKIEKDISSISTATENGFFLIEKNQGANNFNIQEYNLEDMELTFITMVNSEKVFYDSNKNLLYANLVVPYEADQSEIIFSLDLEKLINTVP